MPNRGANEGKRHARSPISADPGATNERYIKREQLRELVPSSDMSVWRWTHDPEIAFPRAVKLGSGGRNYWWLPAVLAWLRHRETLSVEGPAGGHHANGGNGQAIASPAAAAAVDATQPPTRIGGDPVPAGSVAAVGSDHRAGCRGSSDAHADKMSRS
jgi:predicted DNA-binding transcriptional regulator AlpA